jgi:hypothetical protein
LVVVMLDKVVVVWLVFDYLMNPIKPNEMPFSEVIHVALVMVAWVAWVAMS